VLGLTTGFFISRKGVIRAQHVGPLDRALIRRYFDQLQ